MKKEHKLYMTMVENGMEIQPRTIDSIKESLRDGNIRFFGNMGFVTWYIDGENLVWNNLVILKEYRSKVNLWKHMKEVLPGILTKHPELKTIMWYSDKHQRPFKVQIGRK